MRKLTNISKKVAATFLAAAMTTALMPMAVFAYDDEDEVSKLPDPVNGVITLTSGDYQMDKDVKGTILVNTDEEVNLNLNGHNITSDKSDAVVNHGTLNIRGKGTVSTTAKESAAVVTFPDGCTYLYEGTYSSKLWYIVKNAGFTDIDDGTFEKTAESTDNFSLIDNGWDGSSDKMNGTEVEAQEDVASMYIGDGTFKGNSRTPNIVKNGYYGELEISGGTFINHTESKNGAPQGNIVLTFDTAKITGGSFTGETAIACGTAKENFNDYDDDESFGARISDGTFNVSKQIVGHSEGTENIVNLALNGGAFNAPLITDDKYCPIKVAGGIFTEDAVTKANSMKNISIDEDSPQAKFTNKDGNYYVFDDYYIENEAYRVDSDTKIVVTNTGYDELILYTAADVTNKAGEDSQLTVNRKSVANGETAISLENQIKALNEEKAELEKQLEEEKAKDTPEALEKAREELEKAKSDLKEAQAKTAEAEAAKKTAEEQSQKSEDALKAANDKLAETEKALDSARAEIAKVTKPGKTKVTKVKAGKKKLTVSWKAVKKIDGYQIQYSTSKKFTKKTTKVKSAKFDAKKKAITTLKSKKTYYVRVRSYVKNDSAKVYSKWSNVKKAKVK